MPTDMSIKQETNVNLEGEQWSVTVQKSAAKRRAVFTYGILLVHFDGDHVVGKATVDTENEKWALLINGEVSKTAFTLTMKLALANEPLVVSDYSASGKVGANGTRLSGRLRDGRGLHWGSYEAVKVRPWQPDFKIDKYKVRTSILLT